MNQIETNVETYLGDRRPHDRYASFDYCFNYFQSFVEGGRVDTLAAGDQLQTSCLQLGFYLASWGMMRGSAVLHDRSLRYLVPVVETVATAAEAIWQVDADDYGDNAQALILDVTARLRRSVPEYMSDTLVTKILLGVYGCVPAWDANFKAGSGSTTFGPAGLERVGHFYRENAASVERYRVPTIDFDAGAPTSRRYTRAEVIDMHFFVAGAALERARRAQRRR